MSLQENEIKNLIRRILDGEKNLFRKIIVEYELRVRSYLAAKLYQQQEVDDLAQETFITAFKKLNTYDPEKSLLSWLFGIAHNHLRNHLKVSKRRNSAMENFRDYVFDRIKSDLTSVGEEYKQDQISRLLYCMDKLPDKLKVIINSGLRGLKADEMKLDMSTNSIYQARFRANNMLRACIQKTEEG